MGTDEILALADEIDEWSDNFKLEIIVPCKKISLGGKKFVCTRQSQTFLDLVFHLNDDHKLSFTEIADILEQLELNPVIGPK